ncbi:hypothetical protein [Aureimonas pseudogalii]|uniref:Uncharacterized protein n=1 Tax=Aureimonas pseudogalii TaxID=1744844 RepID=A0A7W6H7N8_9HYPH|nr:hypothetical protein [Aureimonas pseudogalii]MBB4000149.1 hypothetical protein [Aureimonas pseudogalii]
MRFTADDAFELRGTEDAIILDLPAAQRIMDLHDATIGEFYEFTGKEIDAIDAGDLLAFLGY